MKRIIKKTNYIIIQKNLFLFHIRNIVIFLLIYLCMYMYIYIFLDLAIWNKRVSSKKIYATKIEIYEIWNRERESLLDFSILKVGILILHIYKTFKKLQKNYMFIFLLQQKIVD